MCQSILYEIKKKLHLYKEENNILPGILKIVRNGHRYPCDGRYPKKHSKSANHKHYKYYNNKTNDMARQQVCINDINATTTKIDRLY